MQFEPHSSGRTTSGPFFDDQSQPSLTASSPNFKFQSFSKQRLSPKMMMGLVVLVMTVVGSLAGMMLMNLNQDVRQQASTGPGYNLGWRLGANKECVQCLVTDSDSTLLKCTYSTKEACQKVPGQIPNGQVCTVDTDCVSGNCVTNPEFGDRYCQSKDVAPTSGVSCYTAAPSCSLKFIPGAVKCPSGYAAQRPPECDSTADRNEAAKCGYGDIKCDGLEEYRCTRENVQGAPWHWEKTGKKCNTVIGCNKFDFQQCQTMPDCEWKAGLCNNKDNVNKCEKGAYSEALQRCCDASTEWCGQRTPWNPNGFWVQEVSNVTAE